MRHLLSRLVLSGLLLCTCACQSAPDAPAKSGGQALRVLQLNVWQEGTSVPGGLEKICAVILASKADVAAFSEVRNYKGQDWTAKVLAELKRQAPDQVFCGRFAGGDVGLVSRHPITATHAVFDESKSDTGSVMAWTLALPGNKAVTIASAHLDYRHYALNWVRGYQGGEAGWGERKPRPDGAPDRITDAAILLKYNNESRRDEAIAAFLAFAKAQKERAPGVPLVLCGDFNEGSHLDWTARAKDAFGHHGAVIPWDNSLALQAAGFRDAYRVAHPDEVKFPGFTWPATAFGKATTSWAQKADERDRMDFILVGSGATAGDAWVVGPSTCFIGTAKVPNPGKDRFIGADLPWPSDHKGVLAELRVGE